jgi:Lon protease-like protein
MSEQLNYLRLFPLSLVLFPGVRTPLHIFEDRYKQMINECITLDEPFGVVLVREDVEEEDFPHEYGTAAIVTHVERLSGGRMNIVVQGERRFRIVELVPGHPYRAAMVEFLDPVVPASLKRSKLPADVSDAFTRYVKLLASLAGQSVDALELPDDVEMLASVVASLLAVPLEMRQDLLQQLDVQRLLEQELELLNEQIETLTEVARRPRQAAPLDWKEDGMPFSLN